MYVCASVYVCIYIYTYTYAYTYTCTYIYIHVLFPLSLSLFARVCVSVCAARLCKGALDLRPRAVHKANGKQGRRAESELWVEPGVDEPLALLTQQRGAFLSGVHFGKALGLWHAVCYGICDRKHFLVVGSLLAGRKVQAAVLASGRGLGSRTGMGCSANFEHLRCS